MPKLYQLGATGCFHLAIALTLSLKQNSPRQKLMPLQIALDDVDDVLIVRCSGRIVAGSEVESLQAELAERTKTTSRVVMNMREVIFLDSSGIGTIVRYAGITKSAHGGLKLCCLSEMTSKVLKLTKLDRVIEIHESEADALRSFKQQSKPQSANREGIKVLCVDLSVNVLAYLREFLAQHGYMAMTTASSYDARNMLKAIRPALVILGPHVPGADQEGFQNALKGTPVLELGPEFHVGEAATEAETLISRIKQTIEQPAKAAGN
jgi:anti-anti-sigma factor